MEVDNLEAYILRCMPIILHWIFFTKKLNLIAKQEQK